MKKKSCVRPARLFVCRPQEPWPWPWLVEGEGEGGMRENNANGMFFGPRISQPAYACRLLSTMSAADCYTTGNKAVVW